MNRYPSGITFLYYQDLEYGSYIMEIVLDLSLVMDQGFAKIYRQSNTFYVGIVLSKDPNRVSGDSMLSLNTTQVQNEHDRVSNLDVVDITNVMRLESIPLDSFFFSDKEGHRFEIQEFIDPNHKKIFQ